jgi:hypothetical protein
LHDNGALEGVTVVEVLITKFDDINRRADATQLLEYLDQYERSLVAEFAERGLMIECFRICALPKKDVNLGFVGLEEAVRRWTAPVAQQDVGPVPIADAQRQIDRLYAKSTGEIR